VSDEHESVRLQLTATAPTAACPRGAGPSSSVHRRDQRRLADLPWGRRAVRIQLTGRTCRCRHLACGRRSCTERVPDLVAASGRHTHGVARALRAIGLALGGEAGARLAARLRLAVSAATLLRLLRAATMFHTPRLSRNSRGWPRGVMRSGMTEELGALQV